MAKKPAEPSRPLDASCRFVVLHGDEVFLRHLYTDQLKDALTKAYGPVDTIVFDGLTTPPAEILDECRSFGLIASAKLVIVDNADQAVKEDNRPLFERYAGSLAEAGEKSDAPATLLLRCTTWRAGKLDDLIAPIGTIKACEQVTEGEACAWAIARCKKEHAGLLTREAATALVERVGSSLGRLDSELGKLAAAAGEEGGKPLPITPELVAQFVGQSRETEAWGIQREMLDPSAERCLNGVREALDVSRHPSALIFYALTDLARKVHACGVASRAGANFFQLKGPLRLWGDGGEAIFSAGKQSAPADARRLLRECVEMTVRDRTSLGESERTLERLAIAFAMFNQRRRRA